MTALEPRLTSLDEKVLGELRFARSRRAADVHRQVTRWLPPSRTSRHSMEAGGWVEVVEPERLAPGEPSLDDVVQILRGFEHLGHARCRNGWWTRA